MVYICIPNTVIKGKLFLSSMNWGGKLIANFDFQLGDNLFFYFDTKKIYFTIKMDKFLILDNYLTEMNNEKIFNVIEEDNNITNIGNIRINSQNNRIIIYDGKQLILDCPVKNNIPFGYGRIIENNKIYEGFLRNGLKSGNGMLIIDGKKIYEGEFSNNFFHGDGKIYQKNKILYDGQFQNGKYHGQGIKYFNGKKIYEGDFENNKFHGYGIYYIKDRVFYEGYFENDEYTEDGIFYDDKGNKSTLSQRFSKSYTAFGITSGSGAPESSK